MLTPPGTGRAVGSTDRALKTLARRTDRASLAIASTGASGPLDIGVVPTTSTVSATRSQPVGDDECDTLDGAPLAATRRQRTLRIRCGARPISEERKQRRDPPTHGPG
jgi:hypothetical protein